LELRAIELIPFPQPESLFEELYRILEIYKDGQERDDRAVVFRANILFHKTIYRTCRNPTLIEAIEQHMMKSNAIRSYNSTDPRMIDQMAGEHREMVEALRHEDLLLLKDLTIQHFSPAKDLYIRMNRP
jgi:DNA-binding GntR family transcriptional regulator